MKTYNNFYFEMISLPNLYKAYEKAGQGKKNKQEYLEFSKNLHENLLQIHLELLNKTYSIGNAGLFYANLNNAPSNTNSNIGFRCCSENQADALFSRKFCQLDVHLLLQLSEELSNNFQIKTRAGIQQLLKAVIPAMKIIRNNKEKFKYVNNYTIE